MTTAGIHYQPNNFDRYDGNPRRPCPRRRDASLTIRPSGWFQRIFPLEKTSTATRQV